MARTPPARSGPTIPTPAILALSAHETGSAREEMDRAGADGYVIKGTPPGEIAKALRGGE